MAHLLFSALSQLRTWPSRGPLGVSWRLGWVAVAQSWLLCFKAHFLAAWSGLRVSWCCFQRAWFLEELHQWQKLYELVLGRLAAFWTDWSSADCSTIVFAFAKSAAFRSDFWSGRGAVHRETWTFIKASSAAFFVVQSSSASLNSAARRCS